MFGLSLAQEHSSWGGFQANSLLTGHQGRNFHLWELGWKPGAQVLSLGDTEAAGASLSGCHAFPVADSGLGFGPRCSQEQN